MKFDLTKPCPQCPFRTDCLKGWLGRGRAKEIAAGVTDGQATFSCHKTTEHGDDEEDGHHYPGRDEQHCAGALILLEKIGRPNQMMRISERLGFYDRTKLDMDAPVFDTTAEFIRHHGAKG